jgi:hypothetical protein
LMSAAQTPTDRAIATGGERSTTAPITMRLFIIGHSPRRKKDANVLIHSASMRYAQTNRLCMIDDKTRPSIDICQRRSLKCKVPLDK